MFLQTSLKMIVFFKNEINIKGDFLTLLNVCKTVKMIEIPINKGYKYNYSNY